MNKPDPVAPEIREIEKIIDDAHSTNLLTKINFPYATWFYLAFCEDFIARDVLMREHLSLHQSKYTTEILNEVLKYGLKWLKEKCPKNGDFKRNYNDEHYGYANALFDLAISYHTFSIILTYASRGLIHLRLEDNNILCDKPLYSDWDYEAYNVLIKEKLSDKFNIQDYPIKPHDIQFEIREDTFSYAYGASTISKLREFFEELNKGRFQLPEEWDLGKFKLKDFKIFYDTLFCLCVLRFNARIWAEQYWYQNTGNIGLGFKGSVIVLDEVEIKKRITNYSGLDEKIVSSIIDYLTYGNYDVHNTEPVLQPFIRLNDRQIAISPSLILSSSAERNLIVLLNKLPSERKVYLSLVDDKESLMIGNLRKEINHLSIRFENKIKINANSPDIDCALVDDTNKRCFIIEFKWFFEPAEVRELIEKSEELEKGVNQLLQLKNNPHMNQIAMEKLKIDSSYRVQYVLVSANWIGYSDVQNIDVPIISESIFLRKIKASKKLSDLIEWMNLRAYLPKKGVHYEIEELKYQIEKWSFNWYATSPLISDVFDPINDA